MGSNIEWIFFPFEDIPDAQDVSIMASLSLTWKLGAPGLLSYCNSVNSELFYIPGVFIGDLRGKGAVSVNLT